MAVHLLPMEPHDVKEMRVEQNPSAVLTIFYMVRSPIFEWNPNDCHVHPDKRQSLERSSKPFRDTRRYVHTTIEGIQAHSWKNTTCETSLVQRTRSHLQSTEVRVRLSSRRGERTSWWTDQIRIEYKGWQCVAEPDSTYILYVMVGNLNFMVHCEARFHSHPRGKWVHGRKRSRFLPGTMPSSLTY